jgi:large subunit ribosomal protein L1
MGKKKVALVDLSQGEKAQLKATGVRSQKMTYAKKEKAVEPEYKPIDDTVAAPQAEEKTEEKKESAAPKKVHRKRVRSSRYLEARTKIDKKKAYPLTEAVKAIRETSKVKFDPSVELHLNLTVDKVAGEVTLPHGTGKKLRVEIATDKTLTTLNAGKIDFDILIAAPQMMPKLAKFAKVLGPKGLMPNPKNGTISPDPEAAAKKFSGGLTHYKSEPKAPLMHLVIGKLSFKDDQIVDNLKAIINSVKTSNISAAYLCSSMSPSVRLEIK